MASSLHLTSSLLLLLLMALVSLLISPTHSQNCTSQTFTQTNTTFANCTNLPTLNASIHWTYSPTTRPNPTLNIAFIAPPASPQGWIAWALNPTSTGMLGAQSLIAFRGTNGSVVVRTYNITSYSSIAESRILYNVSNLRGEYSDGVFRIFATLALPSGAAGEVNQVWQVGASVRNGVPERHNFATENLNSRNMLQLVAAAATGDRNGTVTATAPSSGSAAPPVRQSGNDTGGSSRVLGSGLYGVLVLLGLLILGF
ncbi:hypothetical protein ACJIZ3_012330 [Penstemon smallii]|uniref:DOMON domain-containing protein n=1 Tax=Penstemon smallii TaxID=265156 RepID=A0ABD3UPK8_9LAMI